MEIIYLKYLQANPRTLEPTGEMSIPDRPIPLSEIEQLEQLYNNGAPFPKALRELLFLAGDYCNVLEYGVYDTRQEIQEDFRDDLVRLNKTLSRPYFVIECHLGAVYSFVYLDEGDNPLLYYCNLYEDESEWLVTYNQTIPEYINDAIDRLKAGLPLY